MDLWTGRAYLKTNPAVKGFRRFGKGKGAYVNVFAWVESKAAFEERVRRHLKGLDCILVELEKVQLLEARMSREDYPEELIDMRLTATRKPNDTILGAFHTWDQEHSN